MPATKSALSGSKLAFAKARVSTAIVVGITVKRPVLRATVIQGIPPVFRSGNPSKRIALTAIEVAALRSAARVAGLI